MLTGYKVLPRSNFSSICSLIDTTLLANAERFPSLDAVVTDEQTYSFTRLYCDVCKVADAIKREGITQRDVVAVQSGDGYSDLVVFLALLKLEIPQYAIDPLEPLSRQKKNLSVLGATWVLKGRIDSPEGGMFEILKLTNFHKHRLQYEDYPAGTVVIFLSSGTTGKPKVIALSSQLLTEQVKRDQYVCVFQPGDVFYSYSSINYQFTRRRSLVALISGASLMLPSAKPTDLIGFCRQYRVDHLQLTGSQAIRCLVQQAVWLPEESELPSIKSMVLASSLISQPLREYILRHVTENLYISYGTNEFGNISEATPEVISRNPGSVGRINPQVRLKILDSEGKPVIGGRSGRIFVEADSMISGYVKDTDMSRKSFVGNGYFPGDIGRISSEGELIFEGREDDMMIFSGVNIYPRELESLLESHPQVTESAVFPLEVNGHEGVPFAVVSVEGDVTERSLLQWSKERIGWKAPKRIFIVEELPRNNAGKVKKRMLADQVVEAFRSYSPA